MSKPKRRIKKARITHISLVDRGANRMPVLYKSDDDTVELQTLVKEGDEGELLAVVYAPENEDSQGDIASHEVIKEMAYDAMKRGIEIDIQHDLQSLSRDQAWVAESFLVQKDDGRFAGFTDYNGEPAGDLTGAWATVVRIDDPDLRKAYREGQFNGVSMYGSAEVEAEKADTTPEQFLADVGEEATENPPAEEIEMNQEELERLLAKQEERLIAKFEEQLAKSEEAPEAPEVEELIFKGDPTNPADVAAHADKLRAEIVAKSVDFSDLEQVTALQAALGEPEVEVESRVASLEKRLAQLLKGSNVEPEAAEAAPQFEVNWTSESLSKSDVPNLERGNDMLNYLKGKAN